MTRSASSSWLRRGLPLALVAMLAGGAAADSRTDLVARGQAKAKAGAYAEAITLFEAAEAIAPHPEHHCLIALAEFRRGELVAAQARFDRCRALASEAATWTVPAWVAKEERDLTAALAAQAQPPPDDRPVDGPVGDDPAPTTPPPTEVAGVPLVEAHDPGQPSRWGIPVLASGGAIVLAGALVHGLALKPARDDLAAATTPDDYDARFERFSDRRYLVVGLYAAGAVVTATGLYLALTRRDHQGYQLVPSIAPGQATLGVSWSR